MNDRFACNKLNAAIMPALLLLLPTLLTVFPPIRETDWIVENV